MTEQSANKIVVVDKKGKELGEVKNEAQAIFAAFIFDKPVKIKRRKGKPND
jgi:hypothetical protein